MEWKNTCLHLPRRGQTRDLPRLKQVAAGPASPMTRRWQPPDFLIPPIRRGSVATSPRCTPGAGFSRPGGWAEKAGVQKVSNFGVLFPHFSAQRRTFEHMCRFGALPL